MFSKEFYKFLKVTTLLTKKNLYLIKQTGHDFTFALGLQPLCPLPQRRQWRQWRQWRLWRKQRQKYSPFVPYSLCTLLYLWLSKQNFHFLQFCKCRKENLASLKQIIIFMFLSVLFSKFFYFQHTRIAADSFCYMLQFTGKKFFYLHLSGRNKIHRNCFPQKDNRTF